MVIVAELEIIQRGGQSEKFDMYELHLVNSCPPAVLVDSETHLVTRLILKYTGIIFLRFSCVVERVFIELSVDAYM